jgi:hypothetical protein
MEELAYFPKFPVKNWPEIPSFPVRNGIGNRVGESGELL